MSATLSERHTVHTKETVVAATVTVPVEPAALPAKPHRTARLRWPRALIIAGAVAAAVAAGAWYAHYRASGGGAAGNAAGAADGQRRSEKAALGFVAEEEKSGAAATSLRTVPAEVVQKSHLLRLTGTLMADEKSAVASNVSGIVMEVRVDRGSVVRKGDVLVQLDPTDAKNKLDEGLALVEEIRSKLVLGKGPNEFVAEDQPDVKLAKSALGLAASRWQRAEKLLAKDAMSVDDFEAAKVEYECAKQRYEQAVLKVAETYHTYKTDVAKLAAQRKAVADATILAPFDGTVAEKNVALGEQVTGGFIASKLITLVKTDPLRVCMTVPQQSIGQIKAGQKVLFHVDAFPDRAFEAKVRYISPVVTNETRSMVVEAVLPNPDGVLHPGLFATAELQLPESGGRVFVPKTAVQNAGEVARVFVVRDGVAREQIVALGEIGEQKVEVRAGLSGKELLVARPESVHDGDRVGAAP
jgi:RND family efflux transporter MFP subunit